MGEYHKGIDDLLGFWGREHGTETAIKKCLELLETSKEFEADKIYLANDLVISHGAGERNKTKVFLFRDKSILHNGETVTLTGEKERAKINRKLQGPIIQAIKEVIEENKAYLPVTLRGVHYRLLDKGIGYTNHKNSYGKLSRILTQLRCEGDVSFDDITDETRPITLNSFFMNANEFIKDEQKNFLSGYGRNYMQSQNNFYMIVCEKRTLNNVINPIAHDYSIPITTGGGFSSIDLKYNIANQFKDSGKSMMTIFYLSDFDKAGGDIINSFINSMVHDFDIKKSRIEVIKSAVTPRQIDQYGLAHAFDKTTQVEVDALPPETLARELKQTITNSIDLRKFELERDNEQKDILEIERIRKKIKELSLGL